MIRTPSLWPAILLGAIVAIDGDTVRMDGKSYRLLGLDTPETYHAMCHREYEAGQAARRRLEALIAQGATLHPTGRDCRYQRECANLRFQGRGRRRDHDQGGPRRGLQRPRAARALCTRWRDSEPSR